MTNLHESLCGNPHFCFSNGKIDRVQDALDFGFCGECPTDAPSSNPTNLPTTQPTIAPTKFPTRQPTVAPTTGTPTMVPTTGQPTMSPSGFLDSCDEEPPSCTLTPDDGEDRVIFCLQFGDKQSEQCVLLEAVQGLLDLGKSSQRVPAIQN